MIDIQEKLHHSPNNQRIRCAILQVVKYLKCADCLLLRQLAGKHLAPLGETSISTSLDNFELAAFIGEAFIGSAYMLVELYFPDLAMDPLGGQDSQYRLWTSRVNWLRLYIHALKSGHTILLGANYEPSLARLHNRLNVAQTQRDVFKPSIVRGPDHLRHLAELFAESQAFLAQAIDPPRISRLIQNLKSGAQDNASAQEELVQQTIENFSQRLYQCYPELSDIIIPLDYALNQLKLGLRLHSAAVLCQNGGSSTVSLIAQSLLCRPTVRATQKLLSFDLTTLVSTMHISVSSPKWILTKIAALILSQSEERASHASLRPLINLYDSFLELWLSQKAREERVEAESQSLYKQNKLDSAGRNEDLEMEKEFNELFPSFGDLLDDPVSTAEHNTNEIARNVMSVTSIDIKDIHRLHTAWAMHSDSHLDHMHLRSTYFQLTGDLLERIIRDYGGSLNASVDTEGFPRRVEVFLSSSKRPAPATASSFDFYHDPNVSEMSRAASVLDGIRARLIALTSEWPDQMVLRNLLERCQTVQQLTLDTSLAKVLSALEQLLLQTADWETYANKDNTLKVQQHQLTELIVDWRRLELKCWSTLLDRESSSFADSVSAWWPQLYESLVSVVATFEDDSEKLANHLQQLVPLLGTYLTQCPLGQFAPRLALLQSFSKLTKQLREGPTSKSFSLIHDLLESLCVRYLGLLPSVRDSLKKQKATLDKEVGDFIKLASWKDTNVHALKQSAQKTHRVLYKCIRKFRDILRQPVSEVLSLGELPSTGDTFSGPHEFPRVSPITHLETEEPSPLRHVDISLALRNYQTHATDAGRQLVRNCGTSLVHTLTTRIISESKELADTAIPESEGRERHIKALIAQKRRAWSDLLKELKRLGLSASVTSETLAQHQDRVYLLSLHLDPNHGHIFSNVISRVNLQFAKLLEILPSVRDGLRQHHSDISTRDFQRACNLVESSFSKVVEARRMQVFSGYLILSNSYLV